MARSKRGCIILLDVVLERLSVENLFRLCLTSTEIRKKSSEHLSLRSLYEFGHKIKGDPIRGYMRLANENYHLFEGIERFIDAEEIAFRAGLKNREEYIQRFKSLPRLLTLSTIGAAIGGHLETASLLLTKCPRILILDFGLIQSDYFLYAIAEAGYLPVVKYIDRKREVSDFAWEIILKRVISRLANDQDGCVPSWKKVVRYASERMSHEIFWRYIVEMYFLFPRRNRTRIKEDSETIYYLISESMIQDEVLLRLVLCASERAEDKRMYDLVSKHLSYDRSLDSSDCNTA